MKNAEKLLNPPDVGLTEFMKCMRGSFDGYRRTSIMFAALELGIFDMLRDRRSPEDLSSETGYDPSMVAMLCDCLVFMGLLEKGPEGYKNTALAQTHFVTDAEFRYTDFFRQNGKYVLSWRDLAERVRNGPEVLPYEEMFSEDWISSIGNVRMNEGLMSIIGPIEAHVDFGGLRDFMEVGAGHAFHMIGLCHRHPGLVPYVFDKPEIVDVTRKNLSDYGLGGTVYEGDYYVDSIPGTYDLVFISFNPAGSDVGLAPMVRNLVRPGGYLVIRRHCSAANSDPISDMEINLRAWEGMEPRRKRGWGDIRNNSEGYLEYMVAHGMEHLATEHPDRVSELIFLRSTSC